MQLREKSSMIEKGEKEYQVNWEINEREFKQRHKSN